MGADGRVVIPAAVREALGLAAAGPMVLTIDDGTVRIETFERSVQRIREQVRSIVPPTGDAVDRFLAEKRAEVRREQERDAGRSEAGWPAGRAAE